MDQCAIWLKMRRCAVLARHLTAAQNDDEDEDDADEEERFHPASAHQGALPSVPPVVKATKQFSSDPVRFLQVCRVS